MKEEKIEDISGALHGENFGICDFFSAFRTPRYQGFCKSALSSLLLGENQLHSIADALCSTIYLAYLGTRHLVVTTEKESMPLSTLPLHLEKNIRPGNCKISEAPMRLLCIGTTHPQTSFNKPLHRGAQGWGRAVEPHTNHTYSCWGLRIPYTWGSGKRRRLKVSSLSGRADSHLMPHSQHCQKLHKAITRSPGS